MATIAILMPGDMGHGVGEALTARGHEVVSVLAGRSAHTLGLAARAGIADAGSLEDMVAVADLILSIVPPDRALPQAEAVAGALKATGRQVPYADCNAISPATAALVAEALAVTGAPVIDCGIIGLNPIKTPPTRFYVSGPDHSAMAMLASDAITVTPVGDEIGQASALKMVYAACTKGTWTLHTAVLMAAARLGVLDPLLEEFDYSQAAVLKDMRGRTPFLPADAARWVPEMEEIAATFAGAGVTDGFHRGAAEVFRTLAATPFAAETRETLDRSRTLEEAIAAYIAALPPQAER
ncbi:MAG: DUF1932 domain-containing protein [Pseudomonadota bacterium]